MAPDEPIAVTGPDEAAFGGEGCEALVEGCGTDAAARAQLGEWQRVIEIGERRGDALIDGAGWRRWWIAPVDDLEGERVGALRELERDGGHGGRSAVLDRQGEVLSVATQVKIGVAPGVELGRAAQGLAGTDAASALLGVVDDHHSDVVAALQLAQIGEQRGALAAGVLIDAMQAHE